MKIINQSSVPGVEMNSGRVAILLYTIKEYLDIIWRISLRKNKFQKNENFFFMY